MIAMDAKGYLLARDLMSEKFAEGISLVNIETADVHRKMVIVLGIRNAKNGCIPKFPLKFKAIKE